MQRRMTGQRLWPIYTRPPTRVPRVCAAPGRCGLPRTRNRYRLEVLIEHGASLDDDFQYASPIEALCHRHTPPSDRQLRCIARLVLAGACVSAWYVDEAARPSLKVWAIDQLTCQYAPVFVAMAARAGRDAAGAACPLAALDGRMLTTIGAFLRRTKKEVRRVHRLLWILEAEDVDDVRRAAAAARGWRRADHCFVVS